MTTKQLKEIAKNSDVKMWQVAEKLGITPAWLSVKLRNPDGETERKVLDAIYEIAEREAAE